MSSAAYGTLAIYPSGSLIRYTMPHLSTRARVAARTPSGRRPLGPSNTGGALVATLTGTEMITDSQYRRLRTREVVGRKVRTLRPLTNRQIEVPTGTVLTITEKSGGYTLKAPACDTCGVSVYIAKVTPYLLEFEPS